MTGKKFERTTPEAVGISSKSLERLIENLEQVTEMHGIVVMRHEKICAEDVLYRQLLQIFIWILWCHRREKNGNSHRGIFKKQAV